MKLALAMLMLNLGTHQSADEKEAQAVALIQKLATEHDILSQYCRIGHITGSALVVDVENQRVLLHFHKKLSRWLQFGGHMEDGELDPAITAYREAVEESGLSDLVWLSDKRQPLDIDVHTIPARGDQPEHYHLDFRYVLATHQPEAVQAGAGESDQFRWLSLAETAQLGEAIDPALHRLIGKAQELMKSLKIK